MKALRLVLLLAGLVLLAMLPGLVSAAGTTQVIYNSVLSPLPGNVPSLGFTCCGVNEVGDKVSFAGNARNLTSVTVTMSDWAKHSSWPGYTNSLGWPIDITLNIYQPDGTTQIATSTQNFLIPWRPEASPKCPGDDAWWKAGTCYHGIAFNITFSFSGVTLPDQVVYGVTYNTSSQGFNPTGISGPYDSLNVGFGGAPTVGTDVNPDGIYLSCTNATECSTSSVSTTFHEEIGWTGYVPAVRFIAKSK